MTPDENTVASFTGDGGVSEHLAEKTMFPDKFGSLLGLLQSTAKSMARKGRRGTSHLGESCDQIPSFRHRALLAVVFPCKRSEYSE